MSVNEVDYPITDMEEFMILKPITPKKTLMDKRRECLDKIIKLQSRENRLSKDTIRLEKLQDELRELEEKIIEENI